MEVKKVVRKDKGVLRKLNILIEGIPATILSSIKPEGNFIYIHTTIATDKVFYVGKGKNSRFKGGNRGVFWKRVAMKYGVIIKIVADNLTLDEANEMEMNLIKFYGRRDKNEGYLVNLTDGGDGGIGYIPSLKTRENQSVLTKGLNNPNSDKNIYTFINAITNESIRCTKYEFSQLTGSKASLLFFKNKQSTTKDWYLDGSLSEDDLLSFQAKGKGNFNPNSDKNIYTFIFNKTSETFTGTRMDFKDKYGIDVQHLFRAQKSKSCKGWSLLK